MSHGGDIVGEMAFIDGRQRLACVEAMQETKVLVLSGVDFEKLLIKNSLIAISLLKILSLRIREDINLMEKFKTRLSERTLIILQALADHFPDRVIPLSQEDLALLVNASRARVTEALHILETENKVSLDHKKIRVL